VVLACVLGLQSADTSTVGAIAPSLERSLGVGHAAIGGLASIALLVSGLAALPAGVLVDRVRRTRLLAVGIAAWSLTMVACAAAPSFDALLLARTALGVAAAVAGPAVASLTGDYFAPAERARILGLILSGELLGTGVGFLLSGSAAAVLSWRFAFALLAVPGLALALAVGRGLREPARRALAAEAPRERDDDLAARLAAQAGVAPDPALALRVDPARLSLWRTVVHVFRVRTNVLLVLASSLGYFFTAGQQTFGLAYMRVHFGLGQATATVAVVGLASGAVLGVLGSGRLADALLARGRLTARLSVAGTAYVLAALCFLPGTLRLPLLAAAVPFFLAAAFLLAPNPPLDAARLDVMLPGLWGRAESVRTALRGVAQAAAPLAFGLLADWLTLRVAFLLMLGPLALSGVIVLVARRTYPRDVASAAQGAGPARGSPSAASAG
jgi:MFS family permease